MSLVIVRRGQAAREKPTTIVRGNNARLPWVWDALCFGVPFNAASLEATRDIVNGVAPSVVSGLVWSRDNRGNPAALLNATSYLEYPDNPAHDRPVTAVTMYVRIRRAGTGDGSGGILVKRYADTTPWQSWGLFESDLTPNAVQGQVTMAGQTIQDIRSTTIISTSLWISVFLRWINGTPGRLDVLGERGETIATDTSITLTGTIPYVAGEPIRINGTQDPAMNWNAAYSQAMVWSRRLSDTELQALVADPFGWYSPRRETVGVSGGYLVPLGGGEVRIAGMSGGGV